ncbi:MAG: hypothetical protein ACRD0P_20875 [Stackebrandtia sp.]
MPARLDKDVFAGLCQAKGWSSKTVQAEMLDLSLSTVHRMYRGDGVEVDTVVKVLKGLGDMRYEALFITTRQDDADE